MSVLRILVVLGFALSASCGAVQGVSPVSESASSPVECPVFSRGQALGQLVSPALKEVSGLVVSRRDPSVLWVHNDSGDAANLYAVRTDGVLLGTYTLGGITAVDWEDIASDGAYLYIGDIGDNFYRRRSIAVYRVKEPEVSGDQPYAAQTLKGAERLDLVYPDGPKNAETLLFDPVGGELFVISKERDNNRVYRAPGPYVWGAGKVVLERLELGLPFRKAGPGEIYGGEASGGAVSPQGDAILIRGYWHAYWWRRRPGDTVEQALRAPGCEVPVAPPREDGQAEAIGFDLQARGYYTIPEFTAGVPAIRIYYFQRIGPVGRGD